MEEEGERHNRRFTTFAGKHIDDITLTTYVRQERSSRKHSGGLPGMLQIWVIATTIQPSDERSQYGGG
jgi:hypothetical protein